MKHVTITRKFAFEAGHRLLNHEGRCAHPHGHSYEVTIEVTPLDLDDTLDELGRVVDFSILKREVGQWIDTHWDHAFLVHEDDVALLHFLAGNGFRCFSMPYNPTAENIARYLFSVAELRLTKCGIRVAQVTVRETENCTASVFEGFEEVIDELNARTEELKKITDLQS